MAKAFSENPQTATSVQSTDYMGIEQSPNGLGSMKKVAVGTLMKPINERIAKVEQELITKADTEYVRDELYKRYLKTETYNKEEIDLKINNIVSVNILNKDEVFATVPTVQDVLTQYVLTNYGRQPQELDGIIVTLTDKDNKKYKYIYSEASQQWVDRGEESLNVVSATPEVAGISKLYDDLGQNLDGSINQKVVTDSVKRFALRCDNPIINLNQEGSEVNLHVDKVGVDETIEWEFPNINKTVPAGTTDVTLTKDDFKTGGGEVLTNVCPALSSDSFINNSVSSTVDGEIRHCTVTNSTYGIGLFIISNLVKNSDDFFIRVKMKNTNNKVARLSINGNVYFSSIYEDVQPNEEVVFTVIPRGDKTSAQIPFGLYPISNEDVTGFTFDILSSELIDITQLINNHPYFASLSDADKAALLDKGLPYIPAGESFTVGGTAENFVKYYEGSKSETTSSLNHYDVSPTVNKEVEVKKNDVIYAKGLYKQTLLNLTQTDGSAPFLVIGKYIVNTYVPSVFGQLITYSDYMLTSGIDVCVDDSVTSKHQYWYAGTIITEGQPFENKIEWKEAIALNLTTSGWYLALLLRGYTTNAEIQAWLDANVPFFEDTLPFPSFIPQFEVIVRAGTYYASTVIMVANSYYTMEQVNHFIENLKASIIELQARVTVLENK